ncbi:MAG: APC family permease, partial [Myxococcales bacterium]
MTLLDCVGLGINGIIGTGIFLLPAKVFSAAGGLSWAAWFAIGGVCLLVGLCFCEASGRTDKNGGPYLYARDAFGRWVGVGVGWMALAANLFAYGAVARGFGRNLSYLIPPLALPGPQIALAVAVIVGLAALNYRGIRPGALVSDFFSGAKLIPILLFVAAGLFFVDWHRLAIPPPHGESTLGALKVGGLAALFACTGFEYVPVPAGETDNPRRNVPLALFGALFGSILLYVLVQIVFIGTHPDPAMADKPLAE